MIDDGGKLVGIISEGDLMHCPLLEQRILFGTGAEWLGRQWPKADIALYVSSINTAK